MSERRQELLDELERHYGGAGWKAEQSADGTVRAAGPGGVTWIGLPIVPEDLGDERLAGRLADLADQRMPRGRELCPLDILPDPASADDVRALLDRLRLRERGHVEIYSFAA